MSETDPDAVVELWHPRDPVEAQAIKQALEDEGIPCQIDGENATAWAGGSSIIGSTNASPIRLLTLLRFRDKARAFIEAHDWPSYTP